MVDVRNRSVTTPKAASAWRHAVYALVQQVPRGQVTTYKALAQALNTKAYQAIGQALHRNPDPAETPCHRVIKSNGALGGYAWGMEQKRRQLQQEGVVFACPERVDLSQSLWTPCFIIKASI